MKCKKCGYDNPPRARECIRCGQSLLPAIPAGAGQPPAMPDDVQAAASRKRRFLFAAGGVLAVSVLVLLAGVSSFSFSRSFQVSSDNTAVVIEQDGAAGAAPSEEESKSVESPADDYYQDGISNDDPDTYVALYNAKDHTLKLPETDIVLGMPDNVQSVMLYDLNYGGTAEIDTDSGISILITSSATTGNLFSISEQEEYFSDQYNYSRIEGSETRYFYTQMLDEMTLQATIVDHDSSRIVFVNVQSMDGESLHDSPELMKECYRVLNECILDGSNLKKDS